MKAFRWRLFWCIAPVAVALIVTAVASWNYAQSQSGQGKQQGLIFKLGVDLVGGTILVYEVDVTKFKDGKLPDGYRPEQLITALKRRIDPADLYNVTIRPISDTRVEIILPTGGTHGTQEGGKSFTPEEVENVKKLIAEVGSLEFRILANEQDDAAAIEAARKAIAAAKDDKAVAAELDKMNAAGKPPPPPKAPDKAGFLTDKGQFNYTWIELGRNFRAEHGFANAAENEKVEGKPTQMARYWAEAAEKRKTNEAFQQGGLGGPLYYSREVASNRREGEDKDKKYEYFVLARDMPAGMDNPGKYVDRANQTANLEVAFGLKSQGGDLMGALTGQNVDRQMAIVLDGLVMSSANIKSKITTDGQIEGRFTKEQVDRLVTILRSGALPASLKPVPVSENTMGPTLGLDTIRSGTLAVMIAFAAILVFMVIYYRLSGLVACVALLANLLLTVAFMVLVQATYTLPGLAGLVLMLGMAVDANVLIYERLREERERGASIGLAIRNGYDRAFPTIIDTHLSSIFTAIVLYVVGNDQLKGFGISLTVGLIISLFTSLYMTRLMFDFFLSKGWIHELKMMDLKNLPIFNLILGKHIDFMKIRYYWFAVTTLLTVFGITVFLMRGYQGLNIDFTGGTAIGYQLKDKRDITFVRKLLDEDAQKKELKVAEVRKVDGDGYQWQIRYDGEDKPRRIDLPNPVTNDDEMRERAEHLPDLSVEQIFMADPEFSKGNESKIITVRTSEKASELVQLVVNRLMKGELKRIEVSDSEISPDNKDITLTFQDQESKEPAFASPAQVTMLLQREFQAAGLDSIGRQIVVTKEESSEAREGMYQKMVVHLPEAVDRDKLKEVVEGAKTEFADRPQPERLENFDTLLATDTQARAMTAILASWAAILLYLWFRFGNWTFGAATVLCLIHDLFFTLGIIAFCHYVHVWAPGFATLLGLHDFKIDLPTVAALLTLVGYSVNDTIVVFDRIREVRGKNPLLTPQMINDGVNQTLSRTLLTAFSVWLVVFVLYCFGGEGVHLFAFVMVVGVVVGTYSSIYIASPLLLIFGEGVPAKPRREQPREMVRASV
jgi:SecD/SecF fusion protein